MKMAIKIIIMSILLTTAYAGMSLSSVHKLISQNNRIIEGQDAQVGQFPFIVSLQQGNSMDSLYHNCGGSIITKDWVLTAAHCVEEARPYSIFLVKAGKHDLSKEEDSEQVKEVSKRIMHERYEGEVKPYDIGLLKMKTPFELNDRVAIIKLPNSGEEPDGRCTIAGWGSVSKTLEKDFPDILQTAQVPILDRESCQSRVKDTVADTNICTGTRNGGGTGTCHGDSGGPLIYNDRVVGISSWVLLPCGEAMSVFTKVSDYIDWVNNNISD